MTWPIILIQKFTGYFKLHISFFGFFNNFYRDHPFLLEKYAETNPNETAASLNANVQVKKDHLYKTVMCQVCPFCSFVVDVVRLFLGMARAKRLRIWWKLQICTWPKWTSTFVVWFTANKQTIKLYHKQLHHYFLLTLKINNIIQSKQFY